MILSMLKEQRMEKRLAITWMTMLLLLVSACQPSVPTAIPVPVPTVHATQNTRRQQAAVLLALDGARPDWTSTYMQDGTMPNLAALAKRGVSAAYMQTIEPALSIPAYVSLSTGACPSRTGLVSSLYHSLANPFCESTEALENLENLPEPVWRTAMRSGKRTATIFWPGSSFDAVGLQADYMVAVAESNVAAAEHMLSLQEAKDWGAAPSSFSPLQESEFQVLSREGGTVAAFRVLTVDGQDNGVKDYDLLILDTDKNLANGHTALCLGQCSAVTISPRLHSSAAFCFTASSSITATVYHSRVSYTRARPGQLAAYINENLGCPPAAPDAQDLVSGWLSPQQYYDMSEARARWMMEVVLYVYRTYHPDLLLTAQNLIAECARGFLLVDERQRGYASDKQELYASYLQKAHALADAHLGQLLSLVNLADSAVLVVSGHGLLPVHTSVRVNTILRDAKVLQWKTSEGYDELDSEKSKTMALVSEGCGHVYINLQGRDRPGLVPEDEYEKIQQQTMQALENTKDENGQSVFARIIGHQELQDLRLDSANSGDVFVQAAPGYYLSSELGFRKVLAQPPCLAAAGFSATLPEMRAIFVAAGGGLASGVAIPPIHIVDIAPTIARALRVSAANTVDGQAVEGIWQ